MAKTRTKKHCGYCGSHHPVQQCPAYRKMYRTFGKTNHFKAVCRNNKRRRGTVHVIEQEAKNYNHIDTVTINSIRSFSKCFVMQQLITKINKIAQVFLVPKNGEAMLGMLDIETLDVLTIKYNAIHMQTHNK